MWVSIYQRQILMTVDPDKTNHHTLVCITLACNSSGFVFQQCANKRSHRAVNLLDTMTLKRHLKIVRSLEQSHDGADIQEIYEMSASFYFE